MNKESENLRDLLHYLKTDYYKDKPEEYEEKDTECKERLYDMVSEDVKYFSDKVYCNLNQVFYTIPIYVLERSKPSEICELARRFNKSATGIYGLKYDNQTGLVITDIYGNPFMLMALSPNGYLVDNYEFTVYNINGQGCLYRFTESLKEDKFSKEHLSELWKLEDYRKAYYDKIEASYNRYEEIKKYKEYISIKCVETGYAYCVKEVTIKKNIPIKLDRNEIAKYADGWNYCFGGSISQIEDNNIQTVYRVRINTD